MATNDRRNRTQPRNPSAGPRGAGIGASPAPAPQPSVAGPAPLTPEQGAGSRSRFQGGATSPPRSLPTPAPNRPGYRRPQPRGMEGPGGGVTPAATPVPNIQPEATPSLPGAGNQQSAPPEPPPSIPEGTYQAPERTAPRADPNDTLTGDLGTQAAPGARVATSSSASRSTSGGVSGPAPSPGAARQVMTGLGINAPSDAPQADVAPVRGSDTDQTLRDNLQSQQQELYNRYLEASEAAASAPIETPEDFQRASQMRNEAERLGQALGVTTGGGARTFSANRAYDRGIQAAGIGANADAAIANADNAARLGISENTAATSIYGDLLDNQEARTRAEAGVASARAQNAPDPLDQARLQFVRNELEKGNPDNAFNMLMGEPFGEMSLVNDDMGKFTGLVQLRDGSFARISPQIQNQLQEFGILSPEGQ